MNFLLRIDRDLNTWPEPILGGILLLLGVALIILAFLPNHGLLKATAIAWVLLP